MMRFRDKQKLIEDILAASPGLEKLPSRQLRESLLAEVARVYEGSRASLVEKRRMATELFHTMRGFDILQPLLERKDVTEIMVNGASAIFVERRGRVMRSPLVFDDREHLSQVICRCFGRANRVINELHPICSMRLSDGSRIHAVLPPAAPDGPALSIRRFTGIRPRMDELIREGALTREAASCLADSVKQRKNIFISGGTGSGKTTFLNALSAFIPRQERVITIEDTAELDLQGVENLLRMEAREAGPDGDGGVDMADLLRASLRLRPDRIIVGEVRGKEAFGMIEAMSTGHPGSMSTGHGSSPEEMLNRVCLLIQLSTALPWEAIRRLVAASIDLLIQLERRADGVRQLQSIVRLAGVTEARFTLQPLFNRARDGSLHRHEIGLSAGVAK